MIAPLIVLIVLLGVYPKPVLDRITPSVNRLVAHVEQVAGGRQPAVARGGPSGPGTAAAAPTPRAGTALRAGGGQVP